MRWDFLLFSQVIIVVKENDLLYKKRLCNFRVYTHTYKHTKLGVMVVLI